VVFSRINDISVIAKSFNQSINQSINQSRNIILEQNFNRTRMEMYQPARPSAAVRPVRLWPEHFFCRACKYTFILWQIEKKAKNNEVEQVFSANLNLRCEQSIPKMTSQKSGHSISFAMLQF